MRLPWRSDIAERTTAPITPATSITSPSRPASSAPNPRGRTMSPIQLVTPLKTPMITNATARMTRNGLTVSACLRPSSMSARASSPAGPGEVAGRSRASARKATALTAATAP